MKTPRENAVERALDTLLRELSFIENLEQHEATIKAIMTDLWIDGYLKGQT